MFQSETRLRRAQFCGVNQSPLLNIYDRQTAAKDATYWGKHGLIRSGQRRAPLV
jgi:hypothetical protein